MGIVVVVCVEGRDAADEDWVGSDAISGSFGKLWYQDKSDKQDEIDVISLCIFFLIYQSQESHYLYMHYIT